MNIRAPRILRFRTEGWSIASSCNVLRCLVTAVAISVMRPCRVLIGLQNVLN